MAYIHYIGKYIEEDPDYHPFRANFEKFLRAFIIYGTGNQPWSEVGAAGW